MLKSIVTAALASFVLVAHVAAAEAATEPTDIAAAAAEADRLIGAAEAGDLFENISDDEVAKVRHRRSGLECSFNVGGTSNQILVFKTHAPRGDDVGCRSVEDETVTTLYATLYPEPISADTAARRALGEMRQVYGTVKPYKGTTATAQVPENLTQFPQRYASHGEIEVRGSPYFTTLATAAYRGWIFKLRATTPLAQASEGQLQAELLFLMTLMAAIDRPGSIEGPPPSEPAQPPT